MKNFIFPFLLAVTVPALADIQYTTVMSIAQDGQLTPMSTTTTFIKKGLQRDDTQQKIGTVTRTESVVTNIARREKISFDNALKIYAVTPLNGEANGQTQPVISDAAKPTKATKGKGLMVMTLGAQFIGNEKLLDYPVRHYKTSMETDSSGCCGTGHTSLKTEQWMADIELPVLEGIAQPQSNGGSNNGVSDCDITFERKGDVAGFDAANKGLALKRITLDENGKMLMQQQITLLSLAALTDEQFAAPAGFKKLSQSEYDQTRQSAFIKALTQQSGADDNDDAANAAEPDADKAPASDAENGAESVAKEAGKQKTRKKLKLPF